MSNKILLFLIFISFQSLAQTTDYQDFKTKFLKEQTIFSKGNGIEKDSAHTYSFSIPKDSIYINAIIFTKAPNYSVRKDYDVSNKRKNYYKDSTYYVKNKIRARFVYGSSPDLPQPNDTIILTSRELSYLNKWDSEDSIKSLGTLISWGGNVITGIKYSYNKTLYTYNAQGELMKSNFFTSNDMKFYAFKNSEIYNRKPDGTLINVVRSSSTGSIDSVLYAYPTSQSSVITYKSANTTTNKLIYSYLDVARKYITSCKNYYFNTATQSFSLNYTGVFDYDKKNNLLSSTAIYFDNNGASYKEDIKYNGCNKLKSVVSSQQSASQTSYNVSQKIYYFSSCPTDVTDAENEIQSINVFPNPASDELHFSFTEENDALKHISIYDISGRQVLSEKTKNNSINVEKLEKGSYFIKINSETKQYRSKFCIF